MTARYGFPKSARLIHPREFSFRPYHLVNAEYIRFIYSLEGRGRLGLSISKKFLKSAVARNRIRRLAREVFRVRHDAYQSLDINILGSAGLSETWKQLGLKEMQTEFRILDQSLALKKPGGVR